MRLACLAVAFALSTLLSAAASHAADPSGVRRVAVTGQPAPGGGTFDRFSVESLPIVAPINSRGQVAFFAAVLRGRAGEGVVLPPRPQARTRAPAGETAPEVR